MACLHVVEDGQFGNLQVFAADLCRALRSESAASYTDHLRLPQQMAPPTQCDAMHHQCRLRSVNTTVGLIGGDGSG